MLRWTSWRRSLPFQGGETGSKPVRSSSFLPSTASAVAGTMWGIGLLGEGRRVLSAEKRVRNPYALPSIQNDPAVSETS